MSAIKDSMDEIFSRIPRDGSNIQNDEDDGGYTISDKQQGVTFEEKVAQVVSETATSPETIELPRPIKTTVETVKAPEPVKPVAVAPIDDVEALLAESVRKPLPEKKVAVIDCGDDLIVEKTPVKPVEVVKKLDVKPITVVETVPEPVVETPVEYDGPVESLPLKTDYSELDGLLKEPAEVQVPEEVDTSVVQEEVDDDSMYEEWNLTSPAPQWDVFYATKKRYLPFMLRVHGRLPFNRFSRELMMAHSKVEYSLDVVEMYEQMVELQTHRDRIREISVTASDQYYIWKRFMDIFRSTAAKIDAGKVAYSDSASCPHLMDFESYFLCLENVIKGCDGVMKTLESGFDTLNRGVTIVLQSRERPMERYEPNPDYQHAIPHPVEHRPEPLQPKTIDNSVPWLDEVNDNAEAEDTIPLTGQKTWHKGISTKVSGSDWDIK